MEFFSVPKRKRKDFQKSYPRKLTNVPPPPVRDHVKRKESSSNHYFSGDMLAFSRASVYSSMVLFSHDILKRYHETKSWFLR